MEQKKVWLVMSLTLLIVMGIMHPVAATGQYNVKLDSCGSNQYWYNPTSNAPEGWYSVTCSIWLGQPGSGTWLDSVTKTHAIYVGSSDPTTFSYGYLGDTAFTPGKIAFDNSGNLGVTDTGNGNFLMFSPPFDTRGLALSGMVTLKTYNGGTGAAWTFDSCGNVWVVDTTSSQILEFTPPFREGVNASLSIEVPILNYTSYVTTPSDLAFDSSGNLWVVDHHGSRV